MSNLSKSGKVLFWKLRHSIPGKEASIITHMLQERMRALGLTERVTSFASRSCIERLSIRLLPSLTGLASCREYTSETMQKLHCFLQA